MTLTLPPELEGPFVDSTGWYAFFPTEVHPQNVSGNAAIAIAPGNSYQMMWSRNPITSTSNNTGTLGLISSISDQIATELRFLFFPPGDYKIVVEGKYYLDAGMRDAYRIADRDITVHVAAPQFVVLLGAALGGLIAFIIFPQTRNTNSAVTGRTVGTVLASLFGALGACLLSSIVTILLSRISETQFLIRITINDFWGAIAVGFIAAYAGNRVLDNIVPTSTRKQVVKTKDEKEVKTFTDGGAEGEITDTGMGDDSASTERVA